MKTEPIQQMAAIARALEIASFKILILDEPTSSLDAHETRQLFNVMHKLKSEGMAIIFITHFVDQVFEIADRITVLRNGKLVGTYSAKTLSHLELIQKMIGRTLSILDDMIKLKQESSRHIKNEALLTAKELGRSGSVEPFDLELHTGEVVGMAGLLGSGRTEVAQLLFGIDKPTSGSLSVGGIPVKDFSPLGSIGRGVASLQQQARFDAFVHEFNTERPHEALQMKTPAQVYRPSTLAYRGLPELSYPLHDRDVLVTVCGRICMYRKKVNVSTVLAGQRLGIKEVDEGIWIVSFMHYDLAYIDLEQKTLQPLDNPFGAGLLPMS